jgi:hypothetical protein
VVCKSFSSQINLNCYGGVRGCSPRPGKPKLKMGCVSSYYLYYLCFYLFDSNNNCHIIHSTLIIVITVLLSSSWNLVCFVKKSAPFSIGNSYREFIPIQRSPISLCLAICWNLCKEHKLFINHRREEAVVGTLATQN